MNQNKFGGKKFERKKFDFFGDSNFFRLIELFSSTRFIHTVIQVYKTTKSDLPSSLRETISTDHPLNTRIAAQLEAFLDFERLP